MGKYIDVAYYGDVYCGNFSGEESELILLISRAEDVLDLTIGSAGDRFTALPNKLQTAIQKAVCAQVDYFADNGGLSYFSSFEGNNASFSIGSFSYGGGNSGATSKCSPSELCPQARMYLARTGLTYRGCYGT